MFFENLHSWQEFYTTTGRTGRAKYQLCSPRSIARQHLYNSDISELLGFISIGKVLYRSPLHCIWLRRLSLVFSKINSKATGCSSPTANICTPATACFATKYSGSIDSYFCKIVWFSLNEAEVWRLRLEPLSTIKFSENDSLSDEIKTNDLFGN